MDFSKENGIIKTKMDSIDDIKISNELLKTYNIMITDKLYEKSYKYGLKLSCDTYENIKSEIPEEYQSLSLNNIFIKNKLKSIYTSEINDMFNQLNTDFNIDYFYFMNTRTGLNVKNLDIKNKECYNSIPYEHIYYTDETPDIKRGDLDMKVDIKHKHKNLVYVINLTDIIYMDSNVYKKILKGLKENKQYKYLLLIDNIFVKYSETYDEDIKNLDNFHKILPLLQFSLKRVYNKKMFNMGNILYDMYFDNIKNLYPYGNFQNQLLFERNEPSDHKISKFQIPILNKITNIIKSSIEFIDTIKYYDLYIDFNLKYTRFLINQILDNLDYILKTKFIFPIKYVFIYINSTSVKEYIYLLLFINTFKDTILYDKYNNFLEQTNLYTPFSIKYAILDMINKNIKEDTYKKLKLTKMYEVFVSTKCEMCLIHDYKYKCKCGKKYCSKACQKIDWQKELFNHKIHCCKCSLCGDSKFDIKCKCGTQYCSDKCLQEDLITNASGHENKCFK